MPSSPPTDAKRPTRTRRLIAAALLVAAIGAPLVLQRRWNPDEPAAGLDVSTALSRYGFHLRDVASEVGIDFRHRAPELDASLKPIMPLIASVGASVSVVDYDDDGWPDLYATNSATDSKNALYRNLRNGRFADVADSLGVADVNEESTGVSMGSVWGDYDNDGDEDLFVYKWGRPELFRNDGAAGFTLVPAADLGLPDWINANTAVWLDYDDDGLLDLFVGCFYPADVDLWHLTTSKFLPESFEYAKNGGRNYLLHNKGDGTFEEVGERMGLTSTRWTLAASAGDVDRDGFPDLLVANDFGVSELWLNDAGHGFKEVGRASNIGSRPKSGMNATFGDLFNLGDWAMFVSNIAEPGILMHGNDLWLPSDSSGGTPKFRDAASALGVNLGGWTYGAQFADLNNDGWLDLVVANGFVSGPKRQSYWYDYSKVATGYKSVIADANNWPALQGRSLSGYQRDLFWVNDGAGGLKDAASAVQGNEPYDGRAVAVADLWNRGAVDVIVANQRGPLQVFRDSVRPGSHWIAFQLEGTRSNRSAIGAEAWLYRGGRRQLQQVDGGGGFASQRDRRLHFGLGSSTTVDSVVIRWPSGTRQLLRSPAADELHLIVEPR